MVLQGNISGSVSTIPMTIPGTIVSARFVNKSVGTITFNVYVATGSGSREITPLNYILISGNVYIIDTPIILKPGYYLIIAASGSMDYYISITR